ncbi:MAG: hypothetical protein M3Q10_02685 [Chloroflexota bacterium]|nr:hypothetical protein [Chloroflexota bacterium]
MGDPRFEPREEWPNWVREPLEKVGITPYETVDTIRPKIEALGFRIVAMHLDRGSPMSTHPLYYAEVIDPHRKDGILGQYWSPTDFAEALAWATSRVLQDNEEHERRRRERTGTPRFEIPEFGPSDGDLIRQRYPYYEQRVAAAVIGNGGVVAEVAAPSRRTLGLRWDDAEEDRFRKAVVDNARAFAAAEGLGPIRIVLDPGAEGETEIG